MRIVEVTIAPNGDLRVEVHGYQGTDCYDHRIVVIRDALGTRTEGYLKPEYWNQSTQTQEVQA